MVREGVGGDSCCSVSFLKTAGYVMDNPGGGIGVEGDGFFNELVHLGRIEDVPSFLKTRSV